MITDIAFLAGAGALLYYTAERLLGWYWEREQRRLRRVLERIRYGYSL